MSTDGSYLREWAAKLDVPILSVDYRLAPEAPYPRPLDEVFFAYCWALNNMESLGTTGENVVFVADAAGGNLATACVIKCIELGIKLPKGLIPIYSSFAMNYYMAPSRAMSVLELVLPCQLIVNMVNAYAGDYEPLDRTKTPNRQIPKKPENRVIPDIPMDHLLSPYLAPTAVLRKFLQTHIISASFDCCLDESIEFAKKLREVDVDVKFETIEGLSHGFLNYSRVSELLVFSSMIFIKHFPLHLGI
jgi:acetyl esterase/lipase